MINKDVILRHSFSAEIEIKANSQKYVKSKYVWSASINSENIYKKKRLKPVTPKL